MFTRGQSFMKVSPLSAFFTILAVLIVTTAVLPRSPYASNDLSLLEKAIITYNLRHLEKSLSDGSYGGEAGILRITPEVGNSFGLKVLIDKDYLDAKQLLQEAETLLEKALEALAAKAGNKSDGKYVKTAAESALGYRKALDSAREKLLAYRSRLLPDKDERLDESVVSPVLKKVLEESLSRASCNLRDALGYFYNRCKGLDEEEPPLTPQNVRFVNYVFNEFTRKAPETAKNLFDFDRGNTNSYVKLGPEWRQVLGRSAYRYTALAGTALKRHEKSRYPLDLLLFFALMRQESNFEPHNVSPVGAVGLTQIMPGTAKSLGMENIFLPHYFTEADSLVRLVRKLRGKAMDLISEINEENMLTNARQARSLMQESLEGQQKSAALFARYRLELLKGGTDDRLDPRESIEHGLKYLMQMIRIQKGDISLALASYNAGPHRVKQYQGIPPYPETIYFRNRILEYYREYQRRLRMYQPGCQRAR
jgi:hypothetical protein